MADPYPSTSSDAPTLPLGQRPAGRPAPADLPPSDPWADQAPISGSPYGAGGPGAEPYHATLHGTADPHGGAPVFRPGYATAPGTSGGPERGRQPYPPAGYGPPGSPAGYGPPGSPAGGGRPGRRPGWVIAVAVTAGLLAVGYAGSVVAGSAGHRSPGTDASASPDASPASTGSAAPGASDGSAAPTAPDATPSATGAGADPSPTNDPAGQGTPTAGPTTTSSDTVIIEGVYAGAFCRQHWAFGRTGSGVLMQCKPSATDARFRWRRA